MQSYLLAFIITFVVGTSISPLIIFGARKLKFGQNILHYVEDHKKKQGTPTMGGVIFIFAIILVSAFFLNGQNRLAVISLAVFFAYGLIGFLDDLLKIKRKDNLGLRPYQKMIGQGIIACIISVFVFRSGLIPNAIYIPFFNVYLNLGWGIIPLVFFVFLATTNAVNLTDGLDGLAGGVSSVCLMGFFTILQIFILRGTSLSPAGELAGLSLVCASAVGGLFAYLCFNCFPAKIFMGDTGSLALGGLISCIAIFSGSEMFILLFGVMFVVSAVSVILQVSYFKITKGKRIFLMAPLHHHFEKKGVNETKIVTIYLIITAVIAVLTVFLEIRFGGV